jgi:hypothetical protein
MSSWSPACWCFCLAKLAVYAPGENLQHAPFRPCLTNGMQAKHRHVCIVVYMNEEARPRLISSFGLLQCHAYIIHFFPE